MKKTFSILIALALALGVTAAISGPAWAWSGAETIRDETFYVPSSALTLGAWTTVWAGVEGFGIADPFQINLEYQAGILDSDIANINTYMFPADIAYPPDHTDGAWLKNFSDQEHYVLAVNIAGGLTVYEYDGLTQTIVPTIQWTLTGWHQTILAGDIIDHGDGTITLRVMPSGTYRPFVNDPPVNNVEVFSGQLECEVLGYRFIGNVGSLGMGSVLVPILRGSEIGTATGTGFASFTPSSGTLTGLSAVTEGSLPPAAQATKPINFPDGLFSFSITGLTPGETVTVTITLPPGAAPTQYWKYQGGWVQIPMTIVGPPNVITITLVDGGLGDDDGVADGTIVDQGGPGSPAVGWETYPINKLAILAPWIALFAAIMAGASLLVLRRRRGQT